MNINENWKKTFALLWSGQAISLLTSAIIQCAIIWHITAETGSATVLSVAAMFGYLPMALFGPFIGSLIDRWNRKRIMIAADFFIALVSIALAAAFFTEILSIPVICGALFIRAIGTAFHTPCLQAVTPAIVPSDMLTKAGGYTQTLQSVSLIASPAIAAAIYPILPFGVIMLIDVIGAACGIGTVAIAKIPLLQNSDTTQSNVAKEAMEGLRFMHSVKGMLPFAILGSLFSLAYVPVASLYPLMTMGYFGGTTTHAGIVESLFAAGLMLGGLILGVWGGFKNKIITISAATFVMGLTLIFMGVLPASGFILFAALTLITGVSAPFFSAPYMVILQQKTPADYLGRVLGITSSMMTLACPVGLMFSGAFAEKIGITKWFVLSGIITLICFALFVGLKSVRRLDTKKIP